jgi:hypothetical protein
LKAKIEISLCFVPDHYDDAGFLQRRIVLHSHLHLPLNPDGALRNRVHQVSFVFDQFM